MPKKLTALTAIGAAPAATDQWYINDGGVSKSITIANAFNYSRLDDVPLKLGTSEDVVQVLDASGRAGNAAFAGILVGTSVYANAIPANSYIISNITADGDLVFFTNTGGNSIEGMRIDAITRSLVLPSVNDASTPTLSFGDGDTGLYESADDTLHVATGRLTMEAKQEDAVEEISEE